MSDSVMTSNRPYLFRALYEWISDNGMTPHILVDADTPGVRVPDPDRALSQTPVSVVRYSST